MPVLIPVVAALAAAAATEALTASLGVILASALGAVVAGGINLVGSRLFAPKTGAPSLATANGVTQELVRSAVDSHKIIYGQARVGGTLVYARSTNTADDTTDSGTNIFLHIVIALAGHQVEEIGQIYLDDTPVDTDDDGHVTTAPFQTTTTTPTQLLAFVNAIALSSNVLTVTTDDPHGFLLNETVTLADVPSPFAGSGVITAIPTSTTFQIARSGYKDISYSGLSAKAYVPRTLTTTSSYVLIKRHLGAPDQEADPDLVAQIPEWTDDHRLRGIAYVYMRLQFNPDVFIHGIPTLNVLVKGKQCYDPRTDTTAWTDNATLCIRDYLSSAYGFNVPDSRINDTFCIAAANVCDEDVTTQSGDMQNRYTCNGVLDTQYIPLDNLQQLVSALAGAVVFVQGKFRIHAAAYDSSEAEYLIDVSPSILAADVQIQTRPSRSSLFNAVRGVFIDPTNDYQATDFPPATNTFYEQQDGGTRIYTDIQLPFTNDVEMAQRIAKIILEKARQGITVTFPANFGPLKIAPMSVISLTNTAVGWSNKEFRVQKFSFSLTQGITVTLQEESSASYDWNAGEAQVSDPAPDTTLPDPFNVAPPGTPVITESLYTTRNSSGVKSQAVIEWPASTDAFFSAYQPEYKLSADTAWTILPRTTDITATILDTTAGMYDFRVKTINTLGVSSPYAYFLGKVLLGLSAPPSDISGFNFTATQDVAHLSWNVAPELDVQIGGNIVVKHTPDTVSPTWASGLEIARFPGNATFGTCQLLDGTYMIKGVDSTGNWSQNAALIETNIASMIVMNQVATMNFGPDFSGSKIDTAVLNGKLQLDSTFSIMGMPGNVSTWPRISTLGGYRPSGQINSPGYIDLGAVYQCRVSAALDAESFGINDFISSRTNNISTWDSIIGDEVNNVTAQVYIQTTNDDPAGSPTWSDFQVFYSGYYSARAFKFFLTITHNDWNGSITPTTNMAVSDLAIIVEMPNRTEGANSVVVPNTGATITYANAFKVAPNPGITGLDMASGDYWTITSQTNESFFIRFFNSSNTGIQRTMNWAAHGYGLQGG